MRWRWFYFDSIDAKAAQAELNRLAETGLELMEVGLLCAGFEQREGRAPACWVEPQVSKRSEEEQSSYLALCADGGWTLVDSARGLWYFKAVAEVAPAPLQSDSRLEWEYVWRKWLRNRGLGVNYLLLYFVFFVGLRLLPRWRELWQIFFDGPLLFATGTMTLVLVWEMCYFGYILWYRRHCARAVEEGKPIPIPGKRGAVARGILPIAQVTLLLAIPVVFLSNVKGTEMEHGFYVDRHSSPIAQSVEYMTVENGHRLGLERYDCGTAWLARQVEVYLLDRERRYDGLDDRKKGRFHFHGVVEPVPVDLGLEAAWLAELEEGWQCLIYREGTTLIWVEAQAEFRNPDTMVQLRAKIGAETP